jgi:ABC-type thiamin/hydroxymethylpyrimidine transport system permease subunit
MTNADVILMVLLMVVFAGFFVVWEQLKEITNIIRRSQPDDQRKSG